MKKRDAYGWWYDIPNLCVKIWSAEPLVHWDQIGNHTTVAIAEQEWAIGRGYAERPKPKGE